MFDNAFNFGKQIGAWLANGISNIKTKVSNFFSSIGNFFSSGFQNMRQKVNDGLENIKSKFTGIFDNVRNVVKNAIDFIRGLFKFDWELPRIKLPHFSVSGKLDLFATPPQIPSVSIDWYRKAMDEPYIMNGATIFGAANGRLLGGGESGSEVVVGTDKLMKMINRATGSNSRPITINVYGAAGQDIRSLAKEVSKELQNIIDDKEKVYA
jgi:phage-related minor tail protein